MRSGPHHLTCQAHEPNVLLQWNAITSGNVALVGGDRWHELFAVVTARVTETSRRAPGIEGMSCQMSYTAFQLSEYRIPRCKSPHRDEQEKAEVKVSLRNT